MGRSIIKRQAEKILAEKDDPNPRDQGMVGDQEYQLSSLHSTDEFQDLQDREAQIPVGYTARKSSSRPDVRSRLVCSDQQHIFPIDKWIAGIAFFHSTIINSIEELESYYEIELDCEFSQWLRDHKTSYYFDIRPGWAEEPSSIIIADSAQAMLFKLTWM